MTAIQESDAFHPRAGLDDLERFCAEVLAAVGADDPSAHAAARAMVHASRLGIDSHGVRLLPHYVRAIEGGRVNGRPNLAIVTETSSIAVLDADHGHGARATYAAMDKAMALARGTGIGAVSIRNTSHFGAAGAYALAAAEQGFVGLAFCNSDSFVRLHGGAERFHGTNPIAMAAPVQGARPWLLDMATSAIPYNRVLLFRSLNLPLPDGVASDGDGVDTTETNAVEMLAPLGAAFGHKGAALAGLVEILSAAMTGMRLSAEIAPMGGPDFSTPRGMGAFVLVLNPSAFVAPAEFDAIMRRYLAGLRGSRTSPGGEVLAPGDKEWREADRRVLQGAPLDPESWRAFGELSQRLQIRGVAVGEPAIAMD